MKLLLFSSLLHVMILSGAAASQPGSSKQHKTNSFRGLADSGDGLASREGLPSLPGRTNCSWSKVEWNLAYPDWSAFYSIMQVDLEEGQSLEITGDFPGVRYFAFATYNANGTQYSTVDPPSSLYDQELGSTSGTNYFDTNQASPLPSTGTYSLTVTAGETTLTQSSNNQESSSAVLAAPAESGFLIYRLYAPYVDDDFDQGGVPMPQVRIVESGAVLDTCPPLTGDGGLNAAMTIAFNRGGFTEAFEDAPSIPEFRYSLGGQLFPNPDNKYVFAPVVNNRADYLIVTGAAPTFPDTNVEGIVQDPPTQLRYWSFCTNLARSPGPTIRCSNDQETSKFEAQPDSMVGDYSADQLEGLQQYAFVLTGDQFDSALAPGFTWLPLYNNTRQRRRFDSVLILRNMLPDPSFGEAIQNIPNNNADDPQSIEAAEEVMGVYYPRGIRCPRPIFDSAASEDGATAADVIVACKLHSASNNNNNEMLDEEEEENPTSASNNMGEMSDVNSEDSSSCTNMSTVLLSSAATIVGLFLLFTF